MKISIVASLIILLLLIGILSYKDSGIVKNGSYDGIKIGENIENLLEKFQIKNENQIKGITSSENNHTYCEFTNINCQPNLIDGVLIIRRGSIPYTWITVRYQNGLVSSINYERRFLLLDF